MRDRLSTVRTGGMTMAADCSVVTPAKPGVRGQRKRWIPVFTGMTAMGPHSFHGNVGDGAVTCFNVATSLSATNGFLCSQFEGPCETLPNRFCAARFTRGTLTPALSFEEAVS